MTLVARSISYRIGLREVLATTDLAFNPGQLVAVVGPNGAGKTTLVRLLGGDLTPTSGLVTSDGVPLTDMSPLELARRRALLAQGSPQDIPFPVSALVALGRSPHQSVTSAEATRNAVDTAMAAVGVDHLADRIFATLSAGERALASLARILAQDTSILLLDEPTAALDIAVEERTMKKLRERTGDRIIVAVLHDLNLAARYADRVILLDEGAVAADGRPDDVFTSANLSAVYRHPIEVVAHPRGNGRLILVG